MRLDWSPLRNSSWKPEETPLKWIGCLLLLSGWMIVATALLLLTGLAQRFSFIAAGLLVELLGLALLALNYKALQRGRA